MECQFLQWSWYFLRLLSISINLPYCLAWKIVIMFRLVLLITNWIYWTSYENKHVKLLVLHLLLLNSWLIVKMHPNNIVFSIGLTSADVHLKWMNWFYFLIFIPCLAMAAELCVEWIPIKIKVIFHCLTHNIETLW